MERRKCSRCTLSMRKRRLSGAINRGRESINLAMNYHLHGLPILSNALSWADASLITRVDIPYIQPDPIRSVLFCHD
jgi:hypothetical protein